MTTFDTPTTPDTAPAAPVWTPADAAELYGLDAWGQGSFGVSDRGTLQVLPTRDPASAVDLHELVEGLAERGIEAPVLIRFSDMVRQRLTDIRDAFQLAIDESNYAGGYCCVYPIKVNQQRQVVEEIRDFSRELGFGLEAGSKPELLAVLGLTAKDESLAAMPIVCNGFKDDEYAETVVLAAKLGRNIIPVIEQPVELPRLLAISDRYGISPSLGVRIKPATTGTGRWAASGGNRSKFGLTANDLLDAVELLRQHGMLECLNLLHFHIGSQINDVRQVTTAVGELAHI
ncbi:MAG: arginine decarboxylase, partial [Pseudomonadota bacterium]